MTVRWGIAGTGNIAAEFARALARVEGGHLVAVGSRTKQRAQEFAASVGAAHAHGSLAELVADEDVDVVYVASPHSEHAAQAVAALEAGKHVLVEKPLTLDVVQARKVLAAAKGSGRFAMEGMWSRFLPAYARLQELVADGAIGEVRAVQATFGFPAAALPAGRLLDPALGGGALLDLGVYPLHLATFLLGAPDAVAAVATLGPTGVDVDTAVSLRWADGATASAQVSLTTWLPMTGVVVGTDGWVELPAPHHVAESLTLHRHGTGGVPPTRSHEAHPIGGDGLRFEIAHVHACLVRGLRQSPVLPLAQSLMQMEVLDQVRTQIGLQLPSPSVRTAGA